MPITPVVVDTFKKLQQTDEFKKQRDSCGLFEFDMTGQQLDDYVKNGLLITVNRRKPSDSQSNRGGNDERCLCGYLAVALYRRAIHPLADQKREYSYEPVGPALFAGDYRPDGALRAGAVIAPSRHSELAAPPCSASGTMIIILLMYAGDSNGWVFPSPPLLLVIRDAVRRHDSGGGYLRRGSRHSAVVCL